MSDRDVAAPLERLEAIADSVRKVLGDRRTWMTAAEFLAHVEAHRLKHDQERLKGKRISHKSSEVVEYQLKPRVVHNRQMEFECQEVAG